jgi:hypothetical protein
MWVHLSFLKIIVYNIYIKMRFKLNKIILCFLLIFSTSSLATTYIVSSTGNDNNLGTQAAPFRTISKGASKAVAGDTVYVRSGTYVEAVIVWQSGTAAAPIKLHAYPNESPVIDGQNTQPTGNYYALIFLAGNYWDVSGFELKNSRQYGVDMPGQHNSLHKMNVHDSRMHGIIARGDYSLVEDSRISRASLDHTDIMWGSGLVACSCFGSDPITNNAILRRNVSYNNFGEGIATWQADGTIIEDNVSYDNYAVNLYIADAKNVVVQRNLVYATQNSVTLFGRQARGIGMSNEYNGNSLDNVKVINNMVLGTSAPFVYFPNTGPNTLSNTLIAYNTFVNGKSGHAGNGTTSNIVPGSFTNVRFANNISIQEDGTAVSSINPVAGLTLSNNLWSKTPSYKGPTDIVGNPLIAKSGPITPGQLTPEYFKIASTSPAVNKALIISQVTDDFFKNPRGNTPDIGAHEILTSTTTPPPVTPPTTTVPSLSLNKIVTSSSDESTSLLAKNVTDGLLTTRWSSQFSDPQWISIDLGAWYSLNKISLQWEAAAAKEYKIQGSIDNINWFDLYSVANGVGGTEEYLINGVARYVKINGVKRITPYGYSLWEISIYGTIFPCK